jgi:hypothetical protein
MYFNEARYIAIVIYNFFFVFMLVNMILRLITVPMPTFVFFIKSFLYIETGMPTHEPLTGRCCAVFHPWLTVKKEVNAS